MKNEGKKKKDPIDIVVASTIVTILALSIAFVSTMEWGSTESTEATEPVPRPTIAWRVSVEGDNYIIEIIDVHPESLDEVSWTILTDSRLVNSWDDPSGENLRVEGDLIDINFTHQDYNQADVTHYHKFYSRDPTGTPPQSRNHTLFMVYMDVNTDGKLSSGDVIWIRSAENGGPADEDYRFRLINERAGEAYGELILPLV